MAKITTFLSLDVSRKNRIQAIVAKQYDRNSRFLKIQLTDGGKPITVAPASVVTINASRADDQEKSFMGEVNDDGTVTVPITSWMLELDNTVSCDISVEDAEGAKLSSLNFIIEVEHANYSGTEISEDDPQYDVFIQVLANENTRVAAEQTRAANEQARISAETTRKEAETQRITDEQVRVTAEAQRKTKFDTWDAAIGSLDSFDSRISRNDKRITNLEQGLPDDNFVTDFSVAYVKDVPSNALPYAEIEQIGGMTRKCTNLIDAPVTEIKSVGANLFDIEQQDVSYSSGCLPRIENDAFIVHISDNDPYWHMSTKNLNLPHGRYYFYSESVPNCSVDLWTSGDSIGASNNKGFFNIDDDTDVHFELEGASIGETYNIKISIYKDEINEFTPYKRNTLLIPDAVQALEGYGMGINHSYLNVVDFNNRKYIRWVRRLSASEKVLIPAADYIYDNIVYYQLPKKGTADEDKLANNILVFKFDVYKGSQGWDSADRIGTVTGMATYGAYWLGFAKGTTLEEAQAVIDQSDILVTLQSAEIIDISDILSVDNYIEVESGGTITAVNEYGLAVPSEITYQIKEATV